MFSQPRRGFFERFFVAVSSRKNREKEVWCNGNIIDNFTLRNSPLQTYCVREIPDMITAEISDLLTPSPLVRIWNRFFL